MAEAKQLDETYMQLAQLRFELTCTEGPKHDEVKQTLMTHIKERGIRFAPAILLCCLVCHKCIALHIHSSAAMRFLRPWCES
eukprot:4780249-Pleurochrysis_carterae.AAC.4